MLSSNRTPRFSLIRVAFGVLAGVMATASFAQTLTNVITVTDPYSAFTAVTRPGAVPMTDVSNGTLSTDLQTGHNEADFISIAPNTQAYVNGSTTLSTVAQNVPGFMVTSGLLNGADATMFRFRFVDANNSKAYQGSYTLIGLDLNRDSKVDFIFGVNSSSAPPVYDFLKPGTGANDGPSTTSVTKLTGGPSTAMTTSGAGQNFDYNGPSASATVDNYQDQTLHPYANAELTFAISWATLQAAIRAMGTVNGVNWSGFTVNASTGMSFIAYTTQQDNAFNEDIYGTSLNGSTTSTWAAMGAFSDDFTASGKPVPEAATVVQVGLFLLSAVGLQLWRRAKKPVPARC
jgi:hypothetical protein